MLKTGHIDPQEAEHDARTLLSRQHERRTQLIVRKFDSQLVTLLYSVASPLVLLTTVNNNKQRKNKAASISFVVYGQKKGKYYATLGRQTRDETIGDIRQFYSGGP